MKIVRLAPNFLDSDDVLKKFCSKNFKTPYSLELIYLPFVLFRYRMDLTPFFGKIKTEKGLFLVDLLQGVPINIKKRTGFDAEDGLKKEFEPFISLSDSVENCKNRVSIGLETAAQKQVLPLVLEKEAAIQRGRNLLRYDVMRITGSLRYRRIDIIPQPETKVLYYPYWLIYYRNRRKKMTFEVIDGLSGQKEHGEIVSSIKMGLIRKETENENLDPSQGAIEN